MTPHYDISMPIHPQMLSWRDLHAPTLLQTRFMDKGDSCNESTLSCSLHTGSHCDAPYHFLKRGEKLHELDLSAYFGPCWVAEIAGEAVTAAELERANIPANVTRLLLKTGNQRFRKQFDPNYIALDPDAAAWILGRGMVAVGVDYLSVERFANKDCPVHRALLGQQVAVIEGLVLDEVPVGPYLLMAAPLRILDVEAAPLRAILVPAAVVANWADELSRLSLDLTQKT